MKFSKTILCLLFAWLPPAAPAADAPQMGVAAVVNEEVISTLDVNDRIKFIIGTTGLSDTPDVRDRLKLQILRQLADESLQLQEAQKNGIAVSENDIKQAIAAIEQRSHQPPGSFEQYLAKKGLPKLSFLRQLRAQIAWTKLVMTKIRPRVRISDEEVNRASERRSLGPSRKEVKIAAILLPVDKPENDHNIQRLADRLVNEIRDGASFDAVASQFSASEDSSSKEPFWVAVSQMEPPIAEKVTKLSKGEISDPIRTISGYHIVKLLETRSSSSTSRKVNKTEVALKQIVFTLKNDAEQKEVKVMLDIANQVRKNPGSCTDKSVAGFKDLQDVAIDVDLTRGQIDDLPIQIRGMVEALKVGEVTDPFATPRGIQLFMLCERVDVPTEAAPDEGIRETLLREKMDLEVTKYMRNLRRNAFVELRQK